MSNFTPSGFDPNTFIDLPSDEYDFNLGQQFLSSYLNESPNGQMLAQQFNLLNPMTWFTRKAQAAIQEADEGGSKKYKTDNIGGTLLERRRALAEAQKLLKQ